MFSFNGLLSRFPKRSRPLIESGIFGTAAGFSAVVFEVAINWIYAGTLVRFSHWSPLEFAASSFAVMMSTSLISGYLMANFAPEAAGSGIPQVKLAFWKDFGFISWRVGWVKLIAGVLAIGGGASLGREGPSVQLAAATASNLSGLMGTAKTGRRRATAAGAAAGLAATFNTPMAAIAFVLEEILGDLNNSLLGSVAVAAVLGAFVVHAFLGANPSFVLPVVTHLNWNGLLLVPATALVASFIGVVFQKGALGLRASFRKSDLQRVPGWARPAMGGFFTWAIGVSVFLWCGRLGVFALGYDDIVAGLGGNLLGTVALVLLLSKLAGTILSYGSGGCGGIFAPSLFFGAMTGCVIDQFVRALGLELSGDDLLLLMIIGMSSCLGAVVRAPFTSILIVFEMTQEFSLIPALLISMVFSQALCRWMEPTGFYDKVLEQDGHELNTVMPPRDFREWERYPISAIANFHPAIISELNQATLEPALKQFPYDRFFYQHEGQPPGVVLRREAEPALASGQPITVHTVPTCLRGTPIAEVQNLLVESPHGVVMILEHTAGKIVGLVTLHDLLRAQQRFAEQHTD